MDFRRNGPRDRNLPGVLWVCLCVCACAKRDFSFGVGSIVTSLWLSLFFGAICAFLETYRVEAQDAVHVLGRRLGKMFYAGFSEVNSKVPNWGGGKVNFDGSCEELLNTHTDMLDI